MPPAGGWQDDFYDIMDFVPFVRRGSFRAIHDLIASRPELREDFIGEVWWRPIAEEDLHDPVHKVSAISNLVWCLGVRTSAHFLTSFDTDVSEHLPSWYPSHRLDIFQAVYRGGDLSPHHSRCKCLTCTVGTATAYHLTASGTISCFAECQTDPEVPPSGSCSRSAARSGCGSCGQGGHAPAQQAR